MTYEILHLHPRAPAKPVPGQPCNGCGVCCQYEPCPLGRLLSRRRSGECIALRWDSVDGRYCCGAMTDAPNVLRQIVPGAPQRMARALAPLLVRLARRWIGLEQGCDCTLEVVCADQRGQNQGTEGQSAP